MQSVGERAVYRRQRKSLKPVGELEPNAARDAVRLQLVCPFIAAALPVTASALRGWQAPWRPALPQLLTPAPAPVRVIHQVPESPW